MADPRVERYWEHISLVARTELLFFAGTMTATAILVFGGFRVAKWLERRRAVREAHKRYAFNECPLCKRKGATPDA